MEIQPKERTKFWDYTVKLTKIQIKSGDCGLSSQTQSSASVTSIPTTQLLVHIKSLPVSFQLKQPCCPGQQYSTPRENEVSHSEHQAHCPVLGPPRALTLRLVCVCVFTVCVPFFTWCCVRCSCALKLIKYCPTFKCLKRSVVLPEKGRESYIP